MAMTPDRIAREAVLRVGQVVGVDGRRVTVLVDKKKNVSHMLLDGDIVPNISVGGYVEIRKGFLSIIGKVEGEKVEEDRARPNGGQREPTVRLTRTLSLSLVGYVDGRGRFTGGTREMPLVGNEAFLLTRAQAGRVHDMVQGDAPSVSIATLHADDLEVRFPIDGLFNTHIAIFGNTGSGKSNTLAYLYQELFRVLGERNADAFVRNARFVVFDFNGEYAGEACLTRAKHVYNLDTTHNDGDRLPLEQDSLLDIEVLSILADATDKTQKPFLRRAIRTYRKVLAADEPRSYLRGMLRRQVRQVLEMSDKQRAHLLLDYLRQLLPDLDEDGNEVDIHKDLEWHNQSSQFRSKPGGLYFAANPDAIQTTNLYRHVDDVTFGESVLSDVIAFAYIQLVEDVLANRAQNEHVAPVINRLRAKRDDIEKVFAFEDRAEFWKSNVVVVNLNHVNLDMKKTLPLLLAKKLYAAHKRGGAEQTLTVVIDEAHNILSTQSSRETESWKDYRLETFEEIIKEGRKFGVFVTIASQRPNDISPTITSQAHNYFIHRLINQRDLATIASAVSYIDKVTEESIPALPTGTCVFSGVASPMPMKINVRCLSSDARPRSGTREFGITIPRRNE